MFIFSGNTFTLRWTNEAFADLVALRIAIRLNGGETFDITGGKFLLPAKFLVPL